MFFQQPESTIFGMKSLPEEMVMYRYMLVAVWLSSGSFAVILAFRREWWLAAGVFVLINATFECIGYWLSFSRHDMPLWYVVVGTIGMMGASILGLLLAITAK